MIEQALADYATAYGLQSVCLRYFNAAGCDPKGRAGERHDPETHLIPLALAEALWMQSGSDLAETRLSVFGTNFTTPDGSCVRDYIHVNHLSSAHLLAAERLLTGMVQGAEVYNLANRTGYSVLEVIAACREVTGQPIRYQAMPPRKGDPAVLTGDASKAAEVLGWQPAYADLRQIIVTAWKWAEVKYRASCPFA